MSITVSLPDGSQRQLEVGATVFDLAKSISQGLAKKAVIGLVNDKEVDLSHPLNDGDRVKLVTVDDPLGLDTLRHSAAHLMAAAVLEEFKGAQLTIGPVTEDGFFYDIFLPEGMKITEEDFPAIEKRMQHLVKQNAAFTRCVASTENDEVYQKYWRIDGGSNKFKREIVDGLKELGAFSETGNAPEVSFYQTGDFVDLCRGPHVPSTKWLKHTKLMRVSGSYWRADQSREQLVRVYGTAFFTQEELEAHLHMLEEAKRRDHRMLGEQLDLFHFEEDAPGMPFFHSKGALVFSLLQEFMRAQLRRRNYEEVKTPLILSEQLWHTSGHYDNYLENMFFTKRKIRAGEDESGVREDTDDVRPMAVKPMNCPGHVLIFKKGMRSYHNLPLRMGEMGMVHRRELSGVRHGLFRVQAFTQDDAHHFCTPEQIHDEVSLLIQFFFEVYRAFGLTDVRIELSTRPQKSVGSEEIWRMAEAALQGVLERNAIPYKLNPGDGAFYGPKIDFHIRDAIGRTWQCGTIQLDFSMPARFGCEYVGADGGRHVPVMIHRACYGSLERFFGIITEHFAGAFPLWLAPVQVRVIPVSEKYAEHAAAVVSQLASHGLRVEADERNERLGYKIRQSQVEKIPFAIVLGEQEVTSGELNVRSREGGELGSMSVQAFLNQLEPFTVAQLIESLNAQPA